MSEPDATIALKQVGVRHVIERLVRDGTAVARIDGSVHTLFPVAIGPTEGSALRGWVTEEGATRTVEVGLGYGLSALHICEGLLLNGGATHVVIDPHQTRRFRDCGLHFLDDAGVSGLIEHHAEESLLALPALLRQGHTFDLAFVDGNHRFDGVFVDLVYLERLVRPGGIVFLDDYQLPSVERAVSFFLANLGWSLEEVAGEDDRHHWAVVRTSANPDTRAFDYYIDF
jgi:predicted O-methyltransferase YrrM